MQCLECWIILGKNIRTMVLMWRCKPESSRCSNVGGYGSSFTFLVHNHLSRRLGSISSSRDSGHFSLLWQFLSLIHDLKISKPHLVELSVFFGTQALDSRCSSSLLRVAKQGFLAGGSWGLGWFGALALEQKGWGWGWNDGARTEVSGWDFAECEEHELKSESLVWSFSPRHSSSPA